MSMHCDLGPELRDCCGVFGVYGVEDAAAVVATGLYALQHRGEESCGVTVTDGRSFSEHKGVGLVSEVLTEERVRPLKGHIAVGHVRYSTTGSSGGVNVQPFFATTGKGRIAVAHNGNIVNAGKLHRKLVESGTIFQTTMDTELLAHLFAQAPAEDPVDALVAAFSQLRGAYSMVILLEDMLVAVRDRRGIRPLCFGRLGDGYVVSSETSAFDLTGAAYVRDVEPGEMLIVTADGPRSERIPGRAEPAFCIFEYIYFAKPDSVIFGHNVYLTRRRLGMALAEEHPVDADMVMPVPDSGTGAAVGYAHRSGIPFEMGLVRNHYVGRTFIQPSQSGRERGVRLKLNPVAELVKGKRIVLVEDSIVRGTTSRQRVRTLREAGAREIHMRVSCPPHRFPCFYGIDFPSREELVAASCTVEEIAEMIGVDSLAYLSYEGMVGAMPLDGGSFCTACFDGRYPEPVDPGLNKYVME